MLLWLRSGVRWRNKFEFFECTKRAKRRVGGATLRCTSCMRKLNQANTNIVQVSPTARLYDCSACMSLTQVVDVHTNGMRVLKNHVTSNSLLDLENQSKHAGAQNTCR